MDYTIFSHVPKSFDIYIYLNMFRKRKISFHGNQFIIKPTYLSKKINVGIFDLNKLDQSTFVPT